MPLFMDVHENVPEGATAEDVVAAHRADLEKQGQYGVNYLRYWLSEESKRLFCLVEAPDADTARRVHQEAHGLVADQIYRVDEGE